VHNGTSLASEWNDDVGIDGFGVEAFFIDFAASNADAKNGGGSDGCDAETFFLRWQTGEY